MGPGLRIAGATSRVFYVICFGFYLASAICHPPSLQAASLQSGSAFLRMDAAARPGAMAGAYTAPAGDVDSLSYNPAGLAALGRRELMFTHAEWLAGTRYDYAAYAHPPPAGTIAAGLLRLDAGTLEGRDAQRQATGDFSAEDSAYTLAYGRSIGPSVGLGATVKFLNRRIASDNAVSYAMDFGAVGRLPGKPVWVGAAILNVGPGTKFLDQADPLPLTLAVGGACRLDPAWKATLDVKHEPNDQRTDVMLGGEYSPWEAFAVRAGYDAPLNRAGDSGPADLNNFRGGAGFQISNFRGDYTLSPFGDLGLTHRFTFTFLFGII